MEIPAGMPISGDGAATAMEQGGINPAVAAAVGEAVDVLSAPPRSQLVMYCFGNDCQFANNVFSPRGDDNDVLVHACYRSCIPLDLRDDVGRQEYGFAVVQMAFVDGAPDEPNSALLRMIRAQDEQDSDSDSQ